MTRYTKLDGRRSVGTKVGIDEEGQSGGPAEKSRAGKVPEARRGESGGPAPSAGGDPKLLLRRAKLLRLKAKKAKSDETRAKHLAEVKVLEKRATDANGARGALGKRRKEEMREERRTRPRLDPDQQREFRRQQRAGERVSGTRCFVCRDTGHSAKDCPQNVAGGDGATQGKDTVGICFRCGSTEHTLARCRRARTDGALPFATCYICSGKGHLASTCPENHGRGVYPDGGHCKVCGSVEHLAKNCPLDAKRTSAAHSVEAGGVGMLAESDGVGGDDDEFHAVSKRRAAMGGDTKRAPRKKVVSF
ncbi:hypothetical protein MSPP1_001247 [Malassezia sp. CBS 17886]|nr:hypothetical protein MSPP1_001247 [Malassezia sp. CBS 17886]